MSQRAKPKRREPQAVTDMTSGPETEDTRALSEMKRDLLLDHIHARIDRLCVRLDALGSRIDSQQTRVDTRLLMLEAELKELPRMIENGMRAALKDESEGL